MTDDLIDIKARLNKYVQLYEYAPVGYITLSDKGIILDANLTAAAILGQFRKDLIGQPIVLFVVPEDYASCEEKFTKLLTEGEPQVCEVRMFRAGSDIFWGIIEANLDSVEQNGEKVCRLILMDITERKMAETEHREDAERVNLFFDSALDLLCIADMEGYFIKLNKEWERTLGFSIQELEGKKFLDLVHPDDLQFTLDAISTLNGGLEVHNFTNRYRCKDGSYRWIEWRSVPAGKFIYAAARDVTQRKLIDDRLTESEDKFRGIFEASNVSKSLTMPNGEINVNKAYADMLGYTVEELNGKKWQELTPPEDVESVQQQLDLLITHKKKSVRFLKRYIHKNGSIVWCDVSEAARYNANNELDYFITSLVDITEKRTVENQYQLLFDEMLDGLALHEIILDETGKPVDYRFLAVNPAFEIMTGLKKEDIIGKTVLEAMPDTEAYWIETYGKVALTGEPARFEHYSGSISKYFEVTSFRPAPLQFVCIFTDITAAKELAAERVTMQEQLYQMQKMESVGRLAGGVAHDFTNMLGIILGHTDLAMDETGPEHAVYADLQQIRMAASRSADLTKQLLTFARKQTISPKTVEINEKITETLKMLKRLIGEGIDLVWKPGKGIFNVNIDPVQIDQILANLCINARDAIGEIGEVIIETSAVVIDEEKCRNNIGYLPGEYILITVSDNGCGMSKDTLSRLFEPFFTTKDIGKGTGLGLATVYGVVKQNNGFIDVYSEPGRGSIFKIYLSEYNGLTEVVSEQVSDPLHKVESHIALLVEDEPAIANLTKRMLKRLGYEVLLAGTPSDALKIARRQTEGIQLLLTDVIMPEMNGMSLASELKKIFPDLKCLFMSGYTANILGDNSLGIGHSQFLPKPFSIKELSAKVKEVVES